MDRLVVLLEGNICAGKSTVLRKLRRSKLFTVIREPVEKWQKSGMLASFYLDKRRWALAFQIEAFVTRAETWVRVLLQTLGQTDGCASGTESGDTEIVILERSVYADRYVFARNCHESGLMSLAEWTTYCNISDTYLMLLTAAVKALPPDLIVYQYARSEVCHARMNLRARREEEGVPIEYLRDLESMHDDWLLDGFEGRLDPESGRLVLGSAKATVMSVRIVTKAGKTRFVKSHVRVPVLVINGEIKYTPEQLRGAICDFMKHRRRVR